MSVTKLYIRNLAKSPKAAPQYAITLHHGCPCTVKNPTSVWDTPALAETAARSTDLPYSYCKRSQPVETAPEPAAAPAPITTDQINRLVQECAAAAAETGRTADEIRTWLSYGTGSLLMGYANPDLDRTAATVELTVSNMDNSGATRRDQLADLVTALGGGVDSYGVTNATGTGTYSFTVAALVPAFMAESLPTLAAAYGAHRDAVVAARLADFRSELLARPERLSTKDYNRAVFDHRRTLIEEFGRAITESTATAAERAGYATDADTLTADAHARGVARRAAAKAARKAASA